jgi:hypothetical protein
MGIASAKREFRRYVAKREVAERASTTREIRIRASGRGLTAYIWTRLAPYIPMGN